MKKILFALVLILIIPYAHAIAVSFPQEHEIFFEPDKHVTLEYTPVNSDSSVLNILATVEAGKLTPFFRETQKTAQVAPFSTQKITFEFDFPSTLNEGLYPITVDISETAVAGGMSGLTGVRDIVNVISPFEEGFLYARIKSDEYKQAGSPILFNFLVQNIGKTYLQGKKITANLMLKDEMKKQATIDVPPLQPFEKKLIRGSFDSEGLENGEYILIASEKGHVSQTTLTYGQPTLKVLNVPKIVAAQQNDFTATISVEDWATPIQDAMFRFAINSVLNVPKTVVLYPGNNDVVISAMAKPARGGSYPGNVQIIGKALRATGTFTAEVEGSLDAPGGIGFRKTPKKEEPVPVEEEMEEAPVKEEQKNKIFLLLLLIASFAVFSFALGQYLARRKTKNDQTPPITPP